MMSPTPRLPPNRIWGRMFNLRMRVPLPTCVHLPAPPHVTPWELPPQRLPAGGAPQSEGWRWGSRVVGRGGRIERRQLALRIRGVLEKEV